MFGMSFVSLNQVDFKEVRVRSHFKRCFGKHELHARNLHFTDEWNPTRADGVDFCEKSAEEPSELPQNVEVSYLISCS